jgi:hypothetical protein
MLVVVESRGEIDGVPHNRIIDGGVDEIHYGRKTNPLCM